MKAMILAAGMGTRLRPLTNTCPKALVEVEGRPMIYWVIARLAKHGFTDIIINAHHMADQIVAFVNDYNQHHKDVSLAISMEETLLDTGGGIKNAADFFDDDQPFLVHNTDVLTDLDLTALAARHHKTNALATLAVRDRKTQRYLLFDEHNHLCGWKSLQTGETRMARQVKGAVIPLSFMTVYMMSPSIFNLMPDSRSFSIIDVFLAQAAAGYTIQGFRGDSVPWLDLGRVAHIEQAVEVMGTTFFEDLTD